MFASSLSTLRWMVRRNGRAPELRLETLLGDELDRLIGELDLYILSPQAPSGPLEKQVCYVDYLLLG